MDGRSTDGAWTRSAWIDQQRERLVCDLRDDIANHFDHTSPGGIGSTRTNAAPEEIARVLIDLGWRKP